LTYVNGFSFNGVFNPETPIYTRKKIKLLLCVRTRRITIMAKSTFFTAEEIAILSQRGKAAWNNLSEAEKQERIAKSKANNKQVEMTPEQRAEASRKGKELWANLSEAEKQAHIEKSKANNKQATMTEEQRAEASRKGKEAWANLSDEEKAARMAKAKAGMFAGI